MAHYWLSLGLVYITGFHHPYCGAASDLLDHEGAPEAGMLACGWPALLRCGTESVTNYSDRSLGRWLNGSQPGPRGDEPSDAIKDEKLRAPVGAKLR
jgi:hypothetical protein